MKKTLYICDFCGKTEEEVKQLLGKNNKHICNECFKELLVLYKDKK